LEGERSRARRLLPLRQDVLEALQATGRTFALVPVGISYERIAEELPFLRELRDAQRRSLNARQLLGWLRRAQRGQVRLGRVHLSADRPVPLLPSASRPEVVAQLQQGLRRATVCTDFHLSAFVRRHPRAGLDVPTLREAILARGGQVLRAGLHDKGSLQLDAALESSTRKHWEDLFAWDLLAHYPHCRAIGAHLKVGHVGPAPKGAAHVPVDEPHLHGLLEALARPISNDYLAVVQALMQRRRPGQDIEVTLAALRAETLMHDATLLPEILAALQAADLVELDGPGDVIRLRAGPHAVWNAFKKSCALSAQAAKGAPTARAKALAGRAL
jgi:hypothetical protein